MFIYCFVCKYQKLIYDLVNFDCDFIYNSPYSPVFSPIEEFFGTIKAKLINKETE